MQTNDVYAHDLAKELDNLARFGAVAIPTDLLYYFYNTMRLGKSMYRDLASRVQEVVNDDNARVRISHSWGRLVITVDAKRPGTAWDVWKPIESLYDDLSIISDDYDHVIMHPSTLLAPDSAEGPMAP